MARCHRPTVGSTLLDEYNAGNEQPMELFWVMHVIWKEDIAERRGIGQILESALEDSVDGKPAIKSVMLG